MDNTIDIWNITNSFENEMLEEIDKNKNTPIKLLDLSKENYSLFEKFVYDTAMFHFKRLAIDIEKNDYYVEFWCKNKFETHCLHVDCDEYIKRTNLNYIYPLLSCVTYFNDNTCPLIITNIDMDIYKYKEFETQNKIFLSIPRRNKQVTFDGSFFHGSTTLSDDHDKNNSRYMIAINLWDKKPTNVDYYNETINICENKEQIFTKKDSIFTLELQENSVETINVDKSIIHYNFFETLLYDCNETACYVFDKLIRDNTTNIITSYMLVVDNTLEKKEIEIKLKNTYGDIIDDINEIMNEIMNETMKIKYNRFLQRFTFAKVYTPDICRFIINECEKYAEKNGGWTTKRHHNYPTTDLPVEKISSIFALIMETMSSIVEKLKKCYCLHEKFTVKFRDLFVVKYKDNAQTFLDMHHDGSFLSFNILLSDTNDFNGGGTYFEDGLTTHLEQGDILIHSSRIKHAGLPITKGTRYLLVGFVNIDIPIEN